MLNDRSSRPSPHSRRLSPELRARRRSAAHDLSMRIKSFRHPRNACSGARLDDYIQTSGSNNMRKTIFTISVAALLAGASVGAAFAQGAGGGGGGAGGGAGGAGAGAGAGGGAGAGAGDGGSGAGAAGAGGGGITHVERGGQGASSPSGMRNETTPPSNGVVPRR